MAKYKVKISSRGQISIPKKIRDKLDTDFLEMEMLEDKVVSRPSQSILSMGGSLKPYAKKASKKGDAQNDDEKAWESHVKEGFGHSCY